MAGVPSQQIKDALARELINVDVSAPSSAVIDALERGLPDLVRVSPHYFNTEEELDRVVESVRIAARC